MEVQKGERLNIINENLKLFEKENSLTFGTDAYLLSAFLPTKPRAIGVELGLGSGAVSLLALSKNKCSKIYGYEVQKEIAEIAQRNAEHNGFGDRLTVFNEDIRNCNPSQIGKQVDFVFTNPPYMKSDSGKMNETEAKNISRHEIHGTVDDFCRSASKLLKHGGYFYAVYRPDRISDLIFALKCNSLEPKKLTFIHKNTATPPSLLLIGAIKGGKSGLKIGKPIYIYKDVENSYTDEFEKIYLSCSTGD